MISGAAYAQGPEGVATNEILLGSVQDLRGPISVIGTALRQGMKAEVESVYAAGGSHGRPVPYDSSLRPSNVGIADPALQPKQSLAYFGAMGPSDLPTFKTHGSERSRRTLSRLQRS